MVTPPQHTLSSEIGKAVSDIKELQSNPILISISDYIRGSEIFEKEDERETNNLKKSTDSLQKSLDTGIYDDSQIVIIYKEVVGLWERIAWIYQKNVSLANKEINNIKNTVEKFYITKKDSDKQINELENKLKIANKQTQEVPKIKDIKNLNMETKKWNQKKIT